MSDSDLLGIGYSLGIWIFISSTALAISRRYKFLVRGWGIPANQRLSWRENKNRWHRTNSQASGLLTLPPYLLSHCFPSSKGHPWDTLWPAACQCPAGRLLPAESCSLQGPHTYSLALWCPATKWKPHSIWKTNGCCCLGVLEARGWSSWALLWAVTHSTTVTTTRKTTPWLMAELCCPPPHPLLVG